MTTVFDQAWATEERPTQTSMSQDELIAEFHRLDALVKDHGSRRAEIGAALDIRKVTLQTCGTGIHN